MRQNNAEKEKFNDIKLSSQKEPNKIHESLVRLIIQDWERDNHWRTYRDGKGW